MANYWMYNYAPIGDCFGPAPESIIKAWEGRSGPYVIYPYFGYQQKIVLKKEAPHVHDE